LTGAGHLIVRRVVKPSIDTLKGTPRVNGAGFVAFSDLPKDAGAIKDVVLAQFFEVVRALIVGAVPSWPPIPVIALPWSTKREQSGCDSRLRLVSVSQHAEPTR
jgi:hypothetical protein